MNPTSFEACKAALKLLKTKLKGETVDVDHPAIHHVMEVLRSKLESHSPAWKDISFTLSQSQRKDKKHYVKMWLHRTRTTGIRNISNFMYLQN